MSGYYGRSDPDAQWNNALSNVGAAFGNVLIKNADRREQREGEENDKAVFEKVRTGLSEQVGEQGETRADVFGAAKNRTLTLDNWLAKNGFELDDKQRQKALTLLTLPTGDDGPHIKVFAGDVWAQANELPNPERYNGWLARVNSKTGDVDWLDKPAAAKERQVPSGYRERADGTLEAVPGGPADMSTIKGEAEARRGPKEAPDAFDVLTAEEKSAIEQVSGMQRGSLRDTPVQRDRKTGRLHNLPGQLDALQKLMLGTGGAAAASEGDEQPGFVERGKKLLGLGGDGGDVPEVRSQADYDKLPAGASYMSGGKRLIKRGQ